MKLRLFFCLVVLISVAVFVLLATLMSSTRIETLYHIWRDDVIGLKRANTPGREGSIARGDSMSPMRKNIGSHLNGEDNALHVDDKDGSGLNAARKADEANPSSVSHSSTSMRTTGLLKQMTSNAVSPVTTTRPATPGSVTRSQVVTSTLARAVSDGLRRDITGWQNVTPSSSLQVYSAFYDDVTGQTVRVIALGSQKEFLKAKGVWCHVWDSASSPKPRGVNGTAKAFAWKPLHFSGVFVLCPLGSDFRPYAVSITMEKPDQIRNWIPIKYPNGTRKLSVCFPVVNGGYNNVAEMVQTIEFDRILGAEKFFIYENSPRREIKAIMNYYEKGGLLEVLPFSFRVNGSIHYFGQNMAINDCVFRNLHESEFVAVKDLDEVIVPGNFTTLIDLLRDIKGRKVFSKVGSMIARNSFFWKSHPDDVRGVNLGPEAQRLRVQTLTKIWRQVELLPPGKRSKQLVLPDRVLLVGVHGTEVYRPGYHGLVLEKQEATSHHFHKAWSPALLQPENLRRDDAARLKYGVALLRAVGSVYEDMKKECRCEKPW